MSERAPTKISNTNKLVSVWLLVDAHEQGARVYGVFTSQADALKAKTEKGYCLHETWMDAVKPLPTHLWVVSWITYTEPEWTTRDVYLTRGAAFNTLEMSGYKRDDTALPTDYAAASFYDPHCWGPVAFVQCYPLIT